MITNSFLKIFFVHNESFENFSFLKTSAISEEYLGILIYFLFAFFLAMLIIIFSYLLTIQVPETEKLSTYECGFEPYEDARSKFNVRFYIVAVLFIVFDIEIIFLLPWCISISQINILGFWSMIEFVLELGISFIYAWCVGAIEWK
jgi:NADH-quinone oxidoreductase subunit A